MEKGNLSSRQEKVFFSSGDKVMLKQDLKNKPEMLVQSIDKATIKTYSAGEDKGTLLGVTCIWFTTDGALQEHRFNTKDLINLEK